MTVLSFQNIGLKPSQLKAVEQKAKNEGKTPPEYVRTLIEQDLLADQSFDEILRPIRSDFRKGGITNSQLDKMVQRARLGSLNGRRRKTRKAPV